MVRLTTKTCPPPRSTTGGGGGVKWICPNKSWYNSCIAHRIVNFLQLCWYLIVFKIYKFFLILRIPIAVRHSLLSRCTVFERTFPTDPLVLSLKQFSCFIPYRAFGVSVSAVRVTHLFIFLLFTLIGK